ncbi:MAG TPA: tetratricopeptide repeat protein, partial [Opitutaceae bacterium]|nr:tetratricopeptide repeat protein [Opitutaceae bacterium]
MTATLALLAACSRNAEPAVPAAAAPKFATKSADCRACHESVYQAWAESHHAHAHRSVDATDAREFNGREFSLHGVTYQATMTDGRPTLTERRDGKDSRHVVEFVLGYTPLRQFVVPVGNGRFQLTEIAHDPAHAEWFNVFGGEQRRPGEWGHWLGRGMNWNSMCAHCHFTDFNKNYNATTDGYASTWREQGVGCAQCHGDLPANHGTGSGKGKPGAIDRARVQESCAPCHARNELLTGAIQPNASYADFYRLTLPTEPSVFYPDGQMRDEDFNYTSLLLSRMGGKAGVTCLDCHEPHGGKTRLPVENNALCLQCHGNPARPDAIAIDPPAHSHHAAGSAGNQCISCHMPTTTFMQRDPRHDHGFLKPDPLLTKELGIPNACSRCHADKDVDWAIAATDRWYGPKMESRQRTRARVIAAAQKGQPEAAQQLATVIATEEIPVWRATLLSLARPFAEANPTLITAGQAALADASPMVRSAAVQLLAEIPVQRPALNALLKDTSRLVRLDAAWALSEQLPPTSPARAELDAYLAASADQPAGQLRIAQDLFNRGQLAGAEVAVRKAAAWDPESGAMFSTLGTILNAAGRDAEAAAAFWRGAQKNPTDANAAFSAGLAFASAGKLPDAELTLREAVRRDPELDRGWYNLGLLLAQTGRANEAVTALQTAEKAAANVADYPYARATIFLQRGDRAAALTACRRALEIDPNHQPARQLLQQL